MSSYNPNIPIAGTRIDRTYQLISTNFTELNNQWGISGDHVELTSGTNTGKHKKSTYVEQAPAPTTVANEMGVYSFLNPTSMVSDLYVRRESNGVSLQITNSQLAASSGNGATVDGLEIRSANNSTPQTYSAAALGLTTIVNAVVCADGHATQIHIQSLTAASITIQQGGAPTGVAPFRLIVVGT